MYLCYILLLTFCNMLDLETKFAFTPIMAEGDEMGEENMDDTENMEGEEKRRRRNERHG